MRLTLRDVLIEALEAKGMRDPATPPGQVYQDDWFRFYRGERSFRVFRLGRTIDSVALHDAHHLLTGYGTDWSGEAEVVAWELASGGCGRHWFMWLDRLLAIPLTLVAPRASWRALRRGWSMQNLYRLPAKSALDMDYDELRRRSAEASLYPS